MFITPRGTDSLYTNPYAGFVNESKKMLCCLVLANKIYYYKTLLMLVIEAHLHYGQSISRTDRGILFSDIVYRVHSLGELRYIVIDVYQCYLYVSLSPEPSVTHLYPHVVILKQPSHHNRLSMIICATSFANKLTVLPLKHHYN